jgi:hypothetical protein
MQLLSRERPFYKGNLHMHTTASDGELSLERASALYQSMGYDFIAVTDHRRRSCDTHYFRNMLVMAGIEFDFYLINQVIHILGIGVDEGLQQVNMADYAPQTAVNRILAGSGLAVLAHPAWSLNTPETICGLKGIEAVEIYNAVSRPPYSGDRADSMALLDVAAAQGRVLNTLATDDSHYYTGDEGYGFIRLQAEELTQRGVLQALRQGSFHASTGPQIDDLRYEEGVIHLQCSPARHIVFLSNLPWRPGRNFTGQGITSAYYKPSRGGRHPETFVRAVVIDENGRKAWANPILV